MSFLEDCTEVIRCPKCQRVNRLISDATVEGNIVTGSGRCLDCVHPSFQPEHLDFTFSWNILGGEVAVTSVSGEYHCLYSETETETEDECMCEDCERKEREQMMEQARQADEQAVYAVVSGDKETYHLLAVASNKALAEALASRDSGGWVIRYETPVPTRDQPFPVFVVSVGVGERYRIISITSDEKQSMKIATSVRGTVSCFNAMPAMGSSSTVRYYKYFVVLDEERNLRDDAVYYVDQFSRREAGYVGVNPAPMVTRRRRYNDSLPYRFEVSATNRDEANVVASQLYQGLNSGKFNADDFEYNVDYRMVYENGQWEVDPCLLVCADVD